MLGGVRRYSETSRHFAGTKCLAVLCSWYQMLSGIDWASGGAYGRLNKALLGGLHKKADLEQTA